MLNGEEEVWHVIAPIVQDISTTMAMNGSFKIEYYPRSGNKTTDKITKEASMFTSFVLKLYYMPPLWLNSFLEADKPYVRH